MRNRNEKDQIMYEANIIILFVRLMVRKIKSKKINKPEVNKKTKSRKKTRGSSKRKKQESNSVI